MRQRFSVNAAGELEARDGTVLGRLTSITLETPSLLPTPLNPSPTGKEKEDPVVPDQTALLPSPADEVWATYVELMKPRRKELDPASKRLIDVALKATSLSEVKKAIVGCSLSDFHMGRDPQTNGKSYKTLGHILRAKRGGRSVLEQVAFFNDIADAAGVETPGVVAVDRVKLSRAKQDVMTAWEFSADDRAVARGDAARQWLAEHGVEVVANGERCRPSFRIVASGRRFL